MGEGLGQQHGGAGKGGLYRRDIKEPLHDSGEAVADGSGWVARRLFAANSRAIGKKNNAAGRPSPADHRPQGVTQRFLRQCPVMRLLRRPDKPTYNLGMSTIKTWGMLFGLQVLVALIVFSGFLTGQLYFAYFDIGSDSYGQVLPGAMHMAHKLAAEGFTGWSFEFGLGGPTALLLGDPFSLIGMLGGPDHVLALRIWVYLLKIVLGGTFFLLMVRCFVSRWETALITSLAYSFCGFVVINGQWDLEATEFVFFPLMVWAIVKSLRTDNVLALPLVVAAALASSVFFVSVGVFVAFTAAASIATADDPRAVLKTWVVKLLPLVVIGYFLFPVFRNLAMGFGAPYFRISALWVSMILLLLAAKAVDRILVSGVNYTKWLPNADARYKLNSYLGGKYIHSKQPLQRPGFVQVGSSAIMRIYRRELALPLGVMQTRLITKEILPGASFTGRTEPKAVRCIAIIKAA